MRSTSNTDQRSRSPRVLYDGRMHRRLEGQEHGPSPDVVAAVLIEFFEGNPDG